MPLQGKEPFKRRTPQGVIDLDQELFYCKTTNEVFTTYDELFDRSILCSSLVWVCAVTGRGGLTFQEALDSEEKALKLLQSIPFQLKSLLLSFVDKCKCSRLQDLSDHVYGLVQNRYVLGETVEAIVDGTRKTCEITEVLSPGYTKNKSPVKKSETPKKASPAKLRYEVCEKDTEIQVLHVVSPDNIIRPKGALSKDKTKLFLKQCVETQDGVLKVKNNISQKFKLNTPPSGSSPGKKSNIDKTIQEVSSLKNGLNIKNNAPVKNNSISSKNALKNSSCKNALKNSQSPSKLKKTLKSIDADIRKMFPKDTAKLAQLAMEHNPVVLLESKSIKQLKLEEFKKKKEEEKVQLKVKKEEEKKMLNEYLIEWRKRREDLECDDLKDLPQPTPINCGIPRDIFGEAVYILEFLQQFSSLLSLKGTFPQGVSFDLLERALQEKDIEGPFNDLLQLLLLAVFKQQDQEEEQPDNSSDDSSPEDNECETDLTTASAIKAANISSSWPMLYHGCLLRQFPLDPFTITELLRLHLLSSGADITTIASERGNFKNKEDPGLSFKIQNPAILKTLSTTSVFLLSSEQRLQILSVLVEQLLTYPAFREFLEQNLNKLKSARVELAQLYMKRKKGKKKSIDNENNPDNLNVQESDLSALPESKNVPEIGLHATQLPKETKILSEEEKLEQQEFDRKVKELKATISKAHGTLRIESIGTDRAHRSFWVFNSVDGLFVEDCNPFAGLCQPKPTPMHLSINGCKLGEDKLPLSFMRKFLEVISNGSDKENNLSKLNAQSKNKSTKMLLSNLNTHMATSPVKQGKLDSKGALQKPRVVFGMCTSDPKTCLVHGVNPDRLSWGFYSKEMDLDNLINNLNPRGNREFILRRNLIQERMRLKDSLAKCPVNKLNILEPIDEETLVEQRKSARIQGGKSQFIGVHPEEALEVTLRDSILDNEDKIWSGGLGSIKVKDRTAWRTSIENNSYDPQCGSLQGFGLGPADAQPSLEGEEFASTSRAPTPPAYQSPNIRDLSSAIFQLASCVQPKYLCAPLAENDEYRKQMEKALAEIERRKSKEELENEEQEPKKSWRKVKMPKSPLGRWFESLQSCTSLSQLFLHLITLENSITWHRSALKASCKICRRRGDGENMLLCDKCDRGFHMYCLKPPLKCIPKTDWFCPACIPAPPKKEVKQKRRTLNYKEVDSDDDDEEEEEEGSEEESSSEEDEPKNKRNKTRTSETPNSDKCTKCRKPGHLICCDGCPQSLHLACVQPPLRRTPRGSWYCPKCVKKDTKGSTSRSSAAEVSSSYRSVTGKRKSESTVPQRSGRSTSTSQRASEDLLLDVTACNEILACLEKHPDAWPFLSQGRKKKANYSRIIKRPVDLALIHSKLNNINYGSNNQFVADIYLMFQNSEVYNPVKSEEHESTRRLTRYFQTLIRKYKFEDANENGEFQQKRPRRTF